MTGRIRRSIPAKLTLVYAVVIIIAVSLMSSLIYRNNVEVLREKSSGHALTSLQLIGEKVDAYIFQLDQLSAFLYQPETQQLLVRGGDEDELDRMRRIRRFQTHYNTQKYLLNTHINVKDIYFIYPEGEVLAQGTGTLRDDYQFPEQDWFQRAVGQPGSSFLYGPHQQPYNIRSAFTVPVEKDCISYIRGVRRMESNTLLGVFVIDFTIHELSSLLAPMGLDPQSNIYLLNNSEVLYGIGQRDFDPAGLLSADPDAGKSVGSYSVMADGESCLVTRYRSSSSGLTFLWITPYAVILSETVSLQRSITGIALLSCVAIVLLSALLSRTLLRPLGELNSVMLRVRGGDLDVSVSSRSDDEAGQLAATFNSMITRMRYLVREVYLMQIYERDARISALQAQINPHFLYNTLESVNAIAQVHGIREIGVISRALAGMFRYSIEQGGATVPLREELHYTRSYLDILRIRFGTRISFEIDVGEELLEFPVIRMMLQPLIENAVIHGLEPKNTRGHVHVLILAEGSDMRVHVEDNGVGLSARRLEEIRANLARENENHVAEKGGRIGLVNVHQRLRLLYGAGYGLEIDSGQHLFTRVSLRLPLRRETEIPPPPPPEADPANNNTHNP